VQNIRKALSNSQRIIIKLAVKVPIERIPMQICCPHPVNPNGHRGVLSGTKRAAEDLKV
jgi:hypothetical protein